ncbi:MAG: fused MFS/spermidine synthase, partial [Acidobacteriia bacterium]|nr:fused MFS/spermidine synthase [Terriglobia bacterium]
GQADPALRILGLLASTIGLPCLLISSTSPLVQAWYADMKPGSSAYRLYALSNLGSMLGLISFPLLVEPRLRSTIQAREWSIAYVVFAALCVLTAWYAFRHRSTEQSVAQDPSSAAGQPSEPVTRGTWLLWMALAACGSGLLLAVTNHLSQNVAPIPLLWILPLSIYLLSFVLCFDAERVYQRYIWIPLMLAGLGAMAYVKYSNEGNPKVRLAIPVFLAGLFVCCMVCHGELVRRKPPANRLTGFYLMVSAGGVLGGMFVALIAPHVFVTYAELPVLMVVCAALTALVVWKPVGTLRAIFRWPVRIGLVACAIALCGYLGWQQKNAGKDDHLQVRNFYGALRVQDETVDGGKDQPEQPARALIHGTIEHGAQMLTPEFRDEPTSYYIRTSGVGLAEEFLHQRVHMRVGVIGLGAGVIASYCRPEDVYRYYEINPLVEPIARKEFTFLNDCGGDLKVNLGDARLTLESQPPQNFDLLAVDAFSGDAIPVHLLTREAVVEYFRHLKVDGILAVHVSNRYLDLLPIVAGIADELHKRAIVVDDDGSEGKDPAANTWVLLSSTPSVFDDQAFNADWVSPAKANPKIQPWTDDYSNLLQVMDFGKDKKDE